MWPTENKRSARRSRRFTCNVTTLDGLVKGVSDKQPSEHPGGGDRRVRRLEEEAWSEVRCHSARAIRWAKRAQAGKDPYYMVSRALLHEGGWTMEPL